MTVKDDIQVIESYKQLDKLWSRSETNASKRLSNSPRVLEKVPMEDRASNMDMNKDPLAVKTCTGDHVGPRRWRVYVQSKSAQRRLSAH